MTNESKSKRKTNIGPSNGAGGSHYCGHIFECLLCDHPRHKNEGRGQEMIKDSRLTYITSCICTGTSKIRNDRWRHAVRKENHNANPNAQHYCSDVQSETPCEPIPPTAPQFFFLLVSLGFPKDAKDLRWLGL